MIDDSDTLQARIKRCRELYDGPPSEAAEKEAREIRISIGKTLKAMNAAGTLTNLDAAILRCKPAKG